MLSKVLVLVIGDRLWLSHVEDLLRSAELRSEIGENLAVLISGPNFSPQHHSDMKMFSLSEPLYSGIFSRILLFKLDPRFFGTLVFHR